MDEKRFTELKDRATNVLFALDRLPHSGAIIHDRNVLRGRILYRIRRITEKGEAIVARSHRTIDYTLDGLEEYLDEADRFINKHRKKGVRHAKTN